MPIIIIACTHAAAGDLARDYGLLPDQWKYAYNKEDIQGYDTISVYLGHRYYAAPAYDEALVLDTMKRVQWLQPRPFHYIQ